MTADDNRITLGEAILALVTPAAEPLRTRYILEQQLAAVIDALDARYRPDPDRVARLTKAQTMMRDAPLDELVTRHWGVWCTHKGVKVSGWLRSSNGRRLETMHSVALEIAADAHPLKADMGLGWTYEARRLDDLPEEHERENTEMPAELRSAVGPFVLRLDEDGRDVLHKAPNYATPQWIPLGHPDITGEGDHEHPDRYVGVRGAKPLTFQSVASAFAFIRTQLTAKDGWEPHRVVVARLRPATAASLDNIGRLPRQEAP